MLQVLFSPHLSFPSPSLFPVHDDAYVRVSRLLRAAFHRGSALRRHRLQDRQPRVGILVQTRLQMPVPKWHLSIVVPLQTIPLPTVKKKKRGKEWRREKEKKITTTRWRDRTDYELYLHHVIASCHVRLFDRSWAIMSVDHSVSPRPWKF